MTPQQCEGASSTAQPSSLQTPWRLCSRFRGTPLSIPLQQGSCSPICPAAPVAVVWGGCLACAVCWHACIEWRERGLSLLKTHYLALFLLDATSKWGVSDPQKLLASGWLSRQRCQVMALHRLKICSVGFWLKILSVGFSCSLMLGENRISAMHSEYHLR